ncbi:MAG: C39 family peptidase [Anaerolineae bacterium]|nr:C39 family peptidase [Anaerolineae bacterium]
MRSFRPWLLSLLGLLLVLPVAAQQDTTTRPAQPLPAAAYIDGLTMIWQNYNRCSAAALTIQLSHFATFTGDYTAIIRRLNPNAEDMSVRLEEMVAAAGDYGLAGIIRRGGTVERLQALVAAGFPVLLENSYYDGDGGFKDWMSHNRVLVGYDDATQEFLFLDSLLGDGPDKRGVRKSYDDIMERWRAFNGVYLVLYNPADEAALWAALGEDAAADENAARTLAQARAALAVQDDAFAQHNLGQALLLTGDAEAAAAAFDAAIARGLPWRFFWYEFSALEAFIAVGRYDTAETIIRRTLADAPGVEEMYYYIALVYAGRGDVERAAANFRAALFRNPGYAEAQAQLDRLTGQ